MLVDCFPYFNEKELVALRVNYLKNVVDGFILCEANRTHKGEAKPYTAEEDIRDLLNKTNCIQIIQVDLSALDSVVDPWVRERAQRDALGEAMKQLQGDNYFIVSDCDEVPSTEGLFNAVEYLKTCEQDVVWLSLRFLMARADLQVYCNDKPYDWNQSYVMRSSQLKTDKTLSDIRASVNKKTLNTRLDGWHFSWMGDANRKKLKLNSFAHCHDVIPTAAAPLASSEMRSFLESYVAKPGETDPLGRVDHRLHPYPSSLLPDIIFTDKILKEFLLP